MSKRSVGRGWLIVGILAGCGSSSTQTPSDAGAADTGAATDGGGGTGAVDGATPGADAAAADATVPVGADGGADAVVAVGTHTGKITRCDWSDGSARQIKMIRDAVNAMYSGELACVGKVDGSETARFVVGLDFYQAALGKTPAADFTIQCTPVGCSGKGTMTVIYDDAALGVLEMVSLANSDSSSGAFILSKFDTSTGEASGSLEMLSATRGALSASVNGTFDAKLFDCKDVAGCNGRGP
jgi:hypothetical protein